MYLYQRILLLALATSAWLASNAQDISGRVIDAAQNGGLPGANVFWLGTTKGAATDADGRFTLAQPAQWPASLVASFVGYRADTLRLSAMPTTGINFKLSAAIELGQFEVVDRVSGTRLDSRSTISTEIIGQKELKRAACCDLSESFETNATVDVNYSDAISGTKTIRML